MDATLLRLRRSPSMSKRPCSSSSSSDPSLIPNPSSVDDHIDIDSLLDSFLALSTTPSLDLSFDRLLHSRPSDSDKTNMIDRALTLGSCLLEAAKRSARKQASIQNSLLWPLPPDLTIKYDEDSDSISGELTVLMYCILASFLVDARKWKVFSMLDTQSVCYVAAACSLFRKCASDPLCYANIDLTTEVPKVNNVVVSTVIHRAGKVLQSLKLGIVPGPTGSLCPSEPLVYSIRNTTDASGFSWNDKRSRQGKETSILTRSCLASLNGESGAPGPGSLLRRLHLYNIDLMDNTALGAALSTCPSLLDLEIVGLHVELRQTLESVSKHCHLIERLFFESSKTGRDDSLKLPTCHDLVNNCSHLTSLTLRGFKLHDYKARVLVKGFRKLKYVDFSTSYSITGAFLKNLGGSAGGNQLEVLILRDCMHLKEVEVARFSSVVLAGDFKLLRHLVGGSYFSCLSEDISNREGLAADGDWFRRCYSTSFIPVEQLVRERPGFCLLAEFPPEGSFAEAEEMISSDINSDFSMHSQLSSHTYDGSTFIHSSDSSYNSDQGSGNEDSHDSSFIMYEESSDEVDFLSV
ncbi:hypothetical protein LguiA_011501 [Lonicera macranthoides]